MNKNIQNLIYQIEEKFDPDKIILFGSQAYGKPNWESDIDLLVIMNFEGTARHQAATILTTIDYHFALDLLVRSANQISERIKDGDFFLRDVIEKGLVLYDRNST